MSSKKSMIDDWETFFTYELKYGSKGEETKYRISLKIWKKTQGTSIFIQKITNNIVVGNGVYFRSGDLTMIANKLSELNLLSNPNVIEEAEDEGKKSSDRRIDMRVCTTLPKKLTIVLITLVQEGKGTETLDIPLSLCDQFANVLSTVGNIIHVRKMPSDELKISDILKYFSVRYRSQYVKEPKTRFVKDFMDIYKSLSKLLLFKIKNAEADLKAVPFKDVSIALDDMICIHSSCLDWLLTHYYGAMDGTARDKEEEEEDPAYDTVDD